MILVDLAEKGALPDAIIRAGIRRLLRVRLAAERGAGCERRGHGKRDLIASLRAAPIALETAAANEQHYEVPAEFFRLVLGRHLKYSCCDWTGAQDLDAAEAEMLALTVARAEIEDGMRVLDLGCGWGSLSLWLAERQPNTEILAVSNSASQRHHIMAEARARGLSNLEVRTADVNELEPGRTFDRVVSIEMFEHMRNYRALNARIASWLEPDGKLLVHVFCHREYAYPFETDGDDDWMGRHFFTGGLMPSDDLLLHFQDDLAIEEQWRRSGTHYRDTAEAWLERLDQNRERALELLSTDGDGERQLGRWRIFFMSCAELFGYRNGDEWWVSHYRFRRRS